MTFPSYSNLRVDLRIHSKIVEPFVPWPPIEGLACLDRQLRPHESRTSQCREQPAEMLIRGLIAGYGPDAKRSPESIAGSLAGSQFTFTVRR
jgi:hypothetical protein